MEGALSRRAVLAALAASALVAALAAKARLDPSTVFLPERPPARWLRAAGDGWLGARAGGPRFARFRARFEAGPRAVEAELALRANVESEVALDGREALSPAGAAGGRLEARRVLLRAGPGPHELVVVVRAVDGPPLLWAEAPDLGLYTDARWEASVDGGRSWTAAVDASVPSRDALADALPSAARGFRATFLSLLPFLALGAWCARRRERRGDDALDGGLAAVAAAAWLTLAAAALFFLRPDVGYDAVHHVAYVAALARTGRLPAPGDGWQTFEPPLYYALCVPLWRAATALGRESAAWLRPPSLLSGFLLGWACRAFVAAARPGRPRLALAAGLFGWFWPASLTLAQAPGCEPLAAALAALFLAACARRAASPRPPRARDAAALGALLGAALLAKATAALAVPAGLLLLAAPVRRLGAARRLEAAALFGGAALAVGGWFYVRSWILYGAPFIGGWHPVGDAAWWQDPGYRTAGDYARFGAALARPFFAGRSGFWDALYSTFWSDGWQSGAIAQASLPPRPLDWQAAEAWWALVPALLMARGAARALTRADAASAAALVGIGGGVAALAWMSLTAPIYSILKASYLLGLGPLFALLLADGLDGAGGVAGLAAWGGLFAWAASSFRAALPL